MNTSHRSEHTKLTPFTYGISVVLYLLRQILVLQPLQHEKRQPPLRPPAPRAVHGAQVRVPQALEYSNLVREVGDRAVWIRAGRQGDLHRPLLAV